MSLTILHNDNRGRLEAEGNEVRLIDQVEGGDPVAIRFRSINETKGKISIDTLVEGTWRELGYVSFKADERGRTDPAHRDALEVEFWTHITGRAWEDPDYERMFAIRHDGPVFYKGGGPPKRIALRAVANNKIVCAEGGGTQPLIANRTAVGSWETFDVILLE